MTPDAGRSHRPHIVLGVTGGIAAYKAIGLCRRLVDAGAHVIPVMTRDATRFVGEASLSALASEPVAKSLWSERDPIPHTTLGRRADLVLVAPATARLVGTYANGISHDLLTATLLATRAPVVICPAMHTEMWEHPAVQENLERLRRRGVHVVAPAVGRLAGGDVGPGRLAETDTIISSVIEVLAARGVALREPAGRAPVASVEDLLGVRVLVTAGGTREPIDPVRFIGNRSSGKQGHALADAAVRRGARVTLVTTSNVPADPAVEVVEVERASEMEQAVLGRRSGADMVIMAAAVADFRPKEPAAAKLPKAEGVPEVVLEPTPDILAELGRLRSPGQILVGFAAETHEVVANAEEKLRRKGLDLIVANDVSAPGSGFESDTNSVLVLAADGVRQEIALTDKRQVADAVLDAVIALMARRRT